MNSESMVKGFGAKSAGLFSSIAAVLALASAIANAAVVVSTGTVSQLFTYQDFGGGDVVFRLSTQPSGCYGFWLAPSQPGFKTTVAFIMKAQTTGESIQVGGDNAQIWNGSASPFCKVDFVGTP